MTAPPQPLSSWILPFIRQPFESGSQAKGGMGKHRASDRGRETGDTRQVEREKRQNPPWNTKWTNCHRWPFYFVDFFTFFSRPCGSWHISSILLLYFVSHSFFYFKVFLITSWIQETERGLWSCFLFHVKIRLGRESLCENGDKNILMRKQAFLILCWDLMRLKIIMHTEHAQGCLRNLLLNDSFSSIVIDADSAIIYPWFFFLKLPEEARDDKLTTFGWDAI